MSLAQHLTVLEGVDREEPLDVQSQIAVEDEDLEECGSKVSGTWRRGSFDAFAPPETTALLSLDPTTPHVAAYNISTARRIAQVTFAVIACCFASGIVFGFASLKPVLIAEGVYSELCYPNEQQLAGGVTKRGIKDEDAVPCPEQDLRLNLFFIAASITCNMSSLLAGAVLDRYGRRCCYTASAIFMAIGCILMGYAFKIPEFDGYLVGNIFLALGGTFLFVPTYQLANAFPKYSGLIVAVITGAFDASAAIFLFYRLAWEASDGAFEPSQFFFLYLIVPVGVLIGEYTIMPAGPYHSVPELEHKLEKVQDPMRDIHESDEDMSDGELYRVRSLRADRRRAKLDRIEQVFGDREEREERAREVEDRHTAAGIWGVLHGLPAHRQMLTPWFVLILLLTVLQMLRMNYFIATIRSQYRYMLGSDDVAEAINHFFDIALPIGGIAATPFIGVLLNNMSVATMLLVLSGYIAVIGVLNCLPFVWAGYATVICFVLFRPLYYSAVSDYATKVFGFATFGRIYGMLTCLSGVVNFSQSGIDALTHGPLHGDPTPVNIFMGVLGSMIAVVLAAFVYIRSKQYEASLVVPEEEPSRFPDQRLPLIRELTAEYGTMPGRTPDVTPRAE
ncbi:amino acid transporter [Apiospora arundinis]|uniref:Amino acid transporter n=1 Tax=Apiospora arundinis TaxID=335852 RepID=A0ABR2I9G6_9PEZI